jgi:hypothetical protein
MVDEVLKTTGFVNWTVLAVTGLAVADGRKLVEYSAFAMPDRSVLSARA